MASCNCWIKRGIASRLPPLWGDRVTRNLTLLSFLAFYCVLCNIPYWVSTRVLGFSPLGWFCIEYPIVGVVSFFVPRIVTSLLLILFVAADIICGACMTFYVPVREWLENIGVAFASATVHPIYALLLLLLVLITAATAYLFPGKAFTKKQRRLAMVFLLVFSAGISGSDILFIRLTTGHLPATLETLRGTDRLSLSVPRVTRLARVPILRLKRLWDLNAALSASEEKGRTSRLPVPSATAAAIRAAGIFSGESNRPLPNLVVTVVESWGLAGDTALQNALVRPYMQPEVQSKYEVLQGSVPFYGATVAGEARELCGNSIGYYLIRAPAADTRNCLPQRLAALGYDRIALHGMSSLMFDRLVWYRNIGFQEMLFHEQFRKQGLPDCASAFLGTCDASIAAWIGRRLDADNPHPQYIHWMTLNSHLPVPVPSRLPDAAPCSTGDGLEPNTPLCSWYQLIANVHRSIAQVALGPLDRPTVFVLVGDHAPPFGDLALHDRFSQSDVPYVVLVPRSELQPPGRISADAAP